MTNPIKRAIKAMLYPVYERRLLRQLDFTQTPHHVGVILDGNRRWARSNFDASPEEGHKAGAEKIIELLNWCEEADVTIITLWLLSTDNLNRDPEELDSLLRIIASAIDRLDTLGKWEIKPLGALELLPEWLQEKLNDVELRSKGRTKTVVNVAIGYGGRHEIVDAVRHFIKDEAVLGKSPEEIASDLSIDEVSKHLYTAGMPDPELVIRTSGEQRLSGFLLWQSAHSEFYFCEAYWPDFRRVDFLRALRAYAQRHRRFGK
ncbi:MAG TPA: isoprenyl transferase [Candidatus Nanopelagicaceae bacterium]